MKVDFNQSNFLVNSQTPVNSNIYTIRDRLVPLFSTVEEETSLTSN